MSERRACTFETCLEPEAVGCNIGHLKLSDCEHWQRDAEIPGTSRTAPADSEDPPSLGQDIGDRVVRVPWTGNSFGLQDAAFVTACNRVSLVGLVGPYNAGKTTLLTLMYLLIRRGEKLRAGSFAGSASLLGWQNLADKLTWQPGRGAPTFPAHTSRAAGRRPGLLHLAFRQGEAPTRDVLLTDPPGEWFNQWAQREDAPGTEGARWIHEHADRFLLLADRDALSGPQRGQARDHLRDLARRLSVGLGDRQVAVVWTKSDVSISATIEGDLKECFDTELPGHTEFHIQLPFGPEQRHLVEEPCVALMDWVFSPIRACGRPYSLPGRAGSDLFLAYRGQR